MFEIKLEIIDQCRACLSTNDTFSSIFIDNLNEIYSELTGLEVGALKIV